MTIDDARENFMSDVYNTLDFLPTNNEANRIIDSFDRVTSGLKQQPCEDCISRQAVLDINARHYGQMPNHINHEIWNEINALPPVTPKEKIGHEKMTNYERERILGALHYKDENGNVRT